MIEKGNDIMNTIINETERNYLISSMRGLLSEYDYAYNVWALNTIIDEWAIQKAPFIEAFKKHPNYVEGQFMIGFDTNYERTVDKRAIMNFSGYCAYTLAQEMKATLPDVINQRRINNGCLVLPRSLYIFFENLEEFADRNVTEATVKYLAEAIPEVRVHVGEKTSRVVNKICKFLGYDKHPNYNREFAKYADALSPMTIKRHTVLSINPLDYLTMSFGNSWASCHTIDKENRRGMPNSYEGQYSSGTMSYMLDPSSMVFYTVDASYDGKEYWTQPKINRQMFHWGENKLVQSRLYPQGNDCDGSAYEPYRHIVQEIISTIFDFPNLWNTTKGTQAASRYINGQGTHYEDYCYFNNCRLCRPKDDANERYFTVGAEPICIECGRRHDVSENINCCHSVRYCEDCGCRIDDEDDEYWVGDYVYCRDCVSYCESCGGYHRDEEYYIESEQRYICEYCLDNRYVYCDCCHRYEPSDRVRYIEEEDIYICEDCEDEVSTCDCCGKELLMSHLTVTEDNRSLCSDCLS